MKYRRQRYVKLRAAAAQFLRAAGAEAAWRSATNDVPHIYTVPRAETIRRHRATGPRVEALGRIIIRGAYPPSNAIIYTHLQL